MKKFLRDENGQAAIEYILLAGGIIVAAVTIFSIYSSMTKNAAEQLNRSVQEAVTETSRLINESVANMSKGL